MRNILLILAICGIAQVVLAQPIGKATYETMIRVAEQKLAQQDYYNALDYFERAYEEREEQSLLPKIADLQLKLRDYGAAQRTYANLLRRDKDNKYADLRFDYARALKMYERYQDAIEQFRAFIEETDSSVKRARAEQELQGAQMAMQAESVRRNEEEIVDRMGRDISRPYSEYGPALTRSGNLYFTTIDAEEVVYVSEDSDASYAKIYRAVREEDGDYDDPQVLDELINRPGYHTSNSSFSKDGNTMFFTRQRLDSSNVVTESKIYYSVGGDGAWGAANEVAGVNGDWLAKHPADGELLGRKVLFFVSDMEGGFGGLDIYYATYKSESVYGDPINLGPKINTSGDEVTPFYFDGRLYFSSDGQVTYGGKDIFFSDWDGRRWSEPENMGTGYNSSQDDQYFALDADGLRGVLTSNRPGGRSVYSRTCCDDIYAFEMEQITADLVVGVFTQKKQALIGATVQLEELSSLGMGKTTSQTQAEGNRFDFPLELEKAYKVSITREGYYPDSFQVSTVDLRESKEYVERIYLRPLPPPEPDEPEYDTITIKEAITLENILYDFDKAEIRPEAEQDLSYVEELMNQYPEMVIELGSHTDNRGNDRYNEQLSQRRADSARYWLVRRGIPGERIVAEGYGEEVPKTVSDRIADQYPFLEVGDILDKAYIDALTEEEQREAAHAINRRTEFKIIEGPTSIIIERKRILKEDGPDRRLNIREEVKDTLPKIHRLSTLFGRQDLTGIPIMQFEKREIDFGKVKRGEKRSHTFNFTNVGDTELVISIVSACDCTTTDYRAGKAYAPGESGSIEVVFDSTEKEKSETIDVDIILENVTPGDELPIIETVRYKYELVQ